MFIGIIVDIRCNCIYYGNRIWIIGIFAGGTTSSYLDLGGLFVDQIDKRKEKEMRPEGSVTAPYGFSERGLINDRKCKRNFTKVFRSTYL